MRAVTRSERTKADSAVKLRVRARPRSCDDAAGCVEIVPKFDNDTVTPSDIFVVAQSATVTNACVAHVPAIMGCSALGPPGRTWVLMANAMFAGASPTLQRRMLPATHAASVLIQMKPDSSAHDDGDLQAPYGEVCVEARNRATYALLATRKCQPDDPVVKKWRRLGRK